MRPIAHDLQVEAGPRTDEARVCKNDLRDTAEEDPFFGVQSSVMAELTEQVRRVAPQDTTLLFTGETGTGKTRMARMIHALSPRRDEPFMVIECGALSPSLIESEMFGHVRGAFTGADRDRPGKFAAAAGGTLLLDEIDSLPLSLQAILLRAVDDRVFEPVGSNKSQRLKARLIAASNARLEREVEAGRFRSDLFYRLNVVGFFLPPLRDRRAAIAPLAGQFAAEFAAQNRPDVCGLSPAAVRALEGYSWPGNVRELRNVIERAVTLCAGPIIQLRDLPEATRISAERAPVVNGRLPLTSGSVSVQPATLAQTREETEIRQIQETLTRHRKNRRRAAAEFAMRSPTALILNESSSGIGNDDRIARDLQVEAGPRTDEARVCKNDLRDTAEEDPFFGVQSSVMAELTEQVRRVAPQDTTLLFTGETGTGKTRMARMIHALSPRRDEPFMVIECGALSPSLIESEMFGHVRGAFTGADRDRPGKFAAAAGGTLLLDEIDSLPLSLQAILLRAVDDRVFEPVGSNKSQRLKARLIAASNARLEREVEAGRFRSDLFYRLNVVGFFLPPLRDRRAAIAPLAGQFAAEFAAQNRPDVCGLSPAAVRALEGYSWPGNVRELRNVIERAVALCAGPIIQLRDLPEATRISAERAPVVNGRLPLTSGSVSVQPATLAQTREETEIRQIQETLARHRNNRRRTAAELGISRMGLYKKLHKYGLIEAT